MTKMKFDDLKAYKADVTIPVYGTIADADVYLKKDVDAAIAELKDKLQNVSELIKETREWLIESQKMHTRCADGAIKKIRHRNFKWCMAMAYAEWLKQMILCNYPESILFRRAFKRERKWKEMAQKFKEADDV